MKGQIPYELILFFHNGFKPRQLIKMGYKPATVYKYSSQIYPKAKKKFIEKTGAVE
jgi:hypothetical protein